MQLMWISGPTGKVRKVSITARHVLVWASVLSFSLVATGFLLYLIGFKIAVEVRPELARSLGGVTTQAEQDRMESFYRERLAAMQSVLDATVQEIRQLQDLKDHFMTLATPVPLREKHGADDGRGGPLIPALDPPSNPSGSLPASLDSTYQEFTQYQKLLEEAQQHWNEQLSWLRSLPTGVPLAPGGDVGVSSGYGLRSDPFTGALARHDGLDFTAPAGTPILAAADGVVSRVGRDANYGNVVEITHAEGFVTRYAHLSSAQVALGQQVRRGDHVADVGNTGRSTGPHLHYEVLRNGLVINPAQVLLLSLR